MMWVMSLWLVAAAPQAADAETLAIFDKAPAWREFLTSVKAQREKWNGNAARATVPPELAARMARAAPGLRLLIVAQDWCLDSVNTVPYVARLASSAQIPVRIVDRAAGQPLMDRYRTRDGRTVTPLVILLRQDRVAGAWVERPAPLQKAFESIATDPEARKRFENRQAWYDADGGRTTMEEIVALAERPASPQRRLRSLDGQDHVLGQAAVAGPGRVQHADFPAERVTVDGAADVGGGDALPSAVGGPLDRDLP
jgi:Thioredoxin